MIRLASWPLVMKVLEPLMRYWLPSFSARVLTPCRSEPAPGSVMAMAPISSPVAMSRQPLLLLLLRAVVEDVGRDDGIVQRDAEAVDADMADRLDDGALMREGAAGAAIFLRHRGAEQAGRARLRPALAVDLLGLLELVVARRDLLRQEAVRHVVEHADILAGPGGFRQAENVGGICGHGLLLRRYQAATERPTMPADLAQNASAGSAIIVSAPLEMRARCADVSGMTRSMKKRPVTSLLS